MKHYPKNSERGVEMVELALILPVLMLICFGVVDLLRISYCESMLQRVAADIAVQARSAPNLDFDLREYASDSGEFSDFVESRSRAVNNGLQSAKQAFSDPGVQSDAQLIATSQVDNSIANYAGTAPAPIISSAVILRPGEEARFNYYDDYGNAISDLVKHPIIPSDGGPGVSGRVPPQRMDALLDLAPIHVEVRAQVHPILWAFLGTRVVKGVATTYREKGIRRMLMVDAATGGEIAPGAPRKGGTPEVWLSSAEPVEPVLAPYGWLLAARRSEMFNASYCAKPGFAVPLPCLTTGL